MIAHGPPPPGAALVFHIGDFKTGSTTIQSMLASGRVRAPGRRLFVPGPPDHRPLAKSLCAPDDPGLREALFRDLARRLGEAAPWDVAIVSSEQFEFAPPEALAGAIDAWLARWRDLVRVIVYVRPHASRTVSTWSEHLKQGFTFGPLEHTHDWLLRHGNLRYARRLARWRAVFGDRLSARPMVPAHLAGGDVAVDFFGRALASDAVDLPRVPPQNRRLSLPDLALLREMNLRLRVLFPRHEARFPGLFWDLAPSLSELDPAAEPRPAMHRGLALRLVADYGEDAAALDAMLGTPGLFAGALEEAVAAAQAEPQSVRAEDWHGAATIRLARAWADALGRDLDARHPAGEA